MHLGKVISGEKDKFDGYRFVDKHLFEVNGRKAYYRLKMIDIDGSFAFSSLVFLSLPLTNVTVYPNPAMNELNIKLMDLTHLSWYVVNSEGFEVLNGKGLTQNFTIDIRNFIPGIYHFVVGSAESKYSIKFFKSN